MSDMQFPLERFHQQIDAAFSTFGITTARYIIYRRRKCLALLIAHNAQSTRRVIFNWSDRICKYVSWKSSFQVKRKLQNNNTFYNIGNCCKINTKRIHFILYSIPDSKFFLYTHVKKTLFKFRSYTYEILDFPANFSWKKKNKERRYHICVCVPLLFEHTNVALQPPLCVSLLVNVCIPHLSRRIPYFEITDVLSTNRQQNRRTSWFAWLLEFHARS